MRAVASPARRERGALCVRTAMASVLALCCCGGATAFVPSCRRAPGALIRREHGVTSAPAQAAMRPRVARLYSSTPPSPGGTDIIDSLANQGKEMSTEEKIAALQREVQAQASVTVSPHIGAKIAAAIRDKESEEEEEEVPDVVMSTKATLDDGTGSSASGSEVSEFVPPENFVDEGKNILWPNPRRAAQLTLLAVVAQLAFIGYIIGLNSFLNAFPIWFGQFVDFIKSGNVRLPS